MPNKLKPCPCGETPQSLIIMDKLCGKWIEVSGMCCGEWTIETRNNYATGDERDDNAAIGWNEAPRATNKGESDE